MADNGSWQFISHNDRKLKSAKVGDIKGVRFPYEDFGKGGSVELKLKLETQPDELYKISYKVQHSGYPMTELSGQVVERAYVDDNWMYSCDIEEAPTTWKDVEFLFKATESVHELRIVISATGDLGEMWKLKGTPRTFIRDLTIKQFSDHKDQVVVSEKKRSQKYDVICLPIIDWSFRFQRPQQIMSRFAESGHRVFYVSTNFLVTNLKNLTKADVDHLIEVNEIANDIFGVKLVSYSNFNIYKDRMSNDHNLRYLTWSLEILEERMAMDNILLFVELPFWTP